MAKNSTYNDLARRVKDLEKDVVQRNPATLGIITDISERKQVEVEEALQESEKRYRIRTYI